LISVKEFQQTSKHYGAELEIIEGGSHDLMLDEEFEKTANAIFSWLKKKLNIFPDLATLNPNKMAKGMNSQKAAKKEPAKTPKEKKEEKREKKKAGYQ
jgi:hypothetical protein